VVDDLLEKPLRLFMMEMRFELVTKQRKFPDNCVERHLTSRQNLAHVTNPGPQLLMFLTNRFVDVDDILLNELITHQARPPAGVVWCHVPRADPEKVDVRKERRRGEHFILTSSPRFVNCRPFVGSGALRVLRAAI
jgi:hypothetical protein